MDEEVESRFVAFLMITAPFFSACYSMADEMIDIGYLRGNFIPCYILLNALLVWGVILFSRRFFQSKAMLFCFVMYFVYLVMIITSFSFLYAFFGMKNGDGVSHALQDAIYLSFITWTTIGYGDLSPMGYGRYIAMAEGIIAYIFMALLVAKLLQLIKLLNPEDAQQR